MIIERIKSNAGIAAGLLVFIAGIWLTAGAGIRAGSTAPVSNQVQEAELVEVWNVGEPVHAWTIEASGRLHALDELQVVAEVAGKISWIDERMRAGGRFSRGETLFRIDPVTFENERQRTAAALQAAEASLLKAAEDQERAVKLHAEGNVSKATLDGTTANLRNAEAAVAQAAAALATASEMLDRTVVSAPFDLIVVSETLSLDSFVSPGQPVANLMGTDRAEMAISLQQYEVFALARTYREQGNKPIPVVASPGNGAVGSLAIEGQIARIAPVVDQQSRTATIIAEFFDVFSEENVGQVFGNDFMSVEIEARTSENLWQVPYGAIRKGRYVWVVSEDQRIRQVPVRVMSTDGYEGIVSADTSLAGKRVMLTLLPEEIEGMRVRIADIPQDES